MVQGAKEPSRQELIELVAANYPQVAKRLLRPLLNLLSLSRQACGGDMDKFLIILVVGIRTTEHPLFSTYSQAQLMSDQPPAFPSLGTNVRSVAESTGAPKETVRRKVIELIEAGWIARQGHELRYTALAYRQLAEVRLALGQLAVANYEAVAALLDRPADRPVEARSYRTGP